MKKIVVIILCLCCHIAAAQNIMKVEHHSFKSSTYHDTRSFRIALPTFAYPDTKYNVLLVLDADYMFDVIASSAIYLQTFDYIPPTAVVAVDYSSPGNRNDVGYDIISNSLNESGELFYKYINTDLEDEIKRLIPTSGFNTLVGHSYTASYLNYWIGNDNDLISAYILFSPEEMQQIPDFAQQDNDAKPIIRIITGKNDTQERQDFGRRLFESLHEKHYDVTLDTVEADHMSVIPTGSTLAVSRLYDKYYNIDSVYDIMDQSDEPVWETFTRTNSHNMSRYRQQFPASSSFISAFLWTAIQNDDKESTSKRTRRSQCLGRHGRFDVQDLFVERGRPLSATLPEPIQRVGAGARDIVLEKSLRVEGIARTRTIQEGLEDIGRGQENIPRRQGDILILSGRTVCKQQIPHGRWRKTAGHSD